MLVLAVAEAGHDIVFLIGAQATMEQPELELGENLGLEAGVFLDGCQSLVIVALFDQGINDEGLATFLDLAADQLVGAFALDGRNNMRVDGQAADGHLVHDGQVEVAVNRERQGAGNGRGGHDQQVGVGAFGAQGGALGNTKAVLLVDDHQLQVLELHGVFDEGVGADDQLDGAVGEAVADFLFVGGGGVTDQKADLLGLQGRWAGFVFRAQQAGEPAVVLLGEDAGGGHDG